MNLIKTLVIGCATYLLIGCSSSEPDVNVSVETNSYSLITTVHVRAIADKVVVKDVVINRGNCTLKQSSINALQNKIELGFGQEFVAVANYCSGGILEVQVTTDNGTFAMQLN